MVRGSSITFEQVKGPLEPYMKRLPDSSREPIAKWLQLLCEWNARIDLTAARTPGQLVELMLQDAGVLSLGTDFMQPGTRVIDVGSGAGAPGLPLAFERPMIQVTLCEPLAKRASFLRTVIGTVGRTDIELLPKRVEDVEGEWDIAISRATFAPEEWLAAARRLVKVGGTIYVFLAKGDVPNVPWATHVGTTSYVAREGAGESSRRVARYSLTAK
jgi:16S rRNA (guanine527-N7)-methyltransferase